jgi:nitroreductase
LGDNKIKENVKWDDALSAQTIMIGATDMGLGGCIIASVEKEALQAELKIPERFDVLLVVAIGYAKEKVVIEDIEENGDIKYYRDSEGVHHVPKRALADIILDI